MYCDKCRGEFSLSAQRQTSHLCSTGVQPERTHSIDPIDGARVAVSADDLNATLELWRVLFLQSSIGGTHLHLGQIETARVPGRVR